MSVAVDIFEYMFDHGRMPAAAPSPVALGSRRAPEVRGAPAEVERLRERIRQMQSPRLEERTLPTHPALASLLDGGLREGAAYALAPSASLVLALLAPPTRAGSWCGVVGMPGLGIEAAEQHGVDLDRLVLVPDPGEQWLAVTSAIADALAVVVTRPSSRTSEATVSRLAARLRERGTTLLVLGPWPQAEAMIGLGESRWSGVGEGFGYLDHREVTVTVTSRRSPVPHSARLLLPDPDQGLQSLESPRGAAGRATPGERTGSADGPRPATAASSLERRAVG